MSNNLSIQPRRNLVTVQREEHIPAVGDIYIHPSRPYEVVRIESKQVNDSYVRYGLSTYSFAEKQFITGGSLSDYIYEESLKQYYHYCIADLDTLLADSEAILAGKDPSYVQEEVALSESTALARCSTSDTIQSYLDAADRLEDRILFTQSVVQARIDEQAYLLRKKKEAVDRQLSVIRKQVRNLERALSIIEIYLGKDISLKQICEGVPASEDTPITFRQRILFMDEEMAVLGDSGMGLTWEDRDKFTQWLKTPEHRDIIVPEQKCVVVMKPRRFDYRYTRDYFHNKDLNRWNHHSYIVMRNGENVWTLDSDNLCIYDKAFPDADTIAKLRVEAEKEAEHISGKDAQEKLEDLNYRTTFFVSVIQGIVDNTDIFSPHGKIDIFKGIGADLIYDDTKDTLLSNGLPSFREYLAEQGKKIRRGSRIIYAKGFSEGHLNRYFYDKRDEPEEPGTGMYSVDELKESNLGKLFFSYLPADSVWSPEKGYHPRERKEAWIIRPETVILYDELSLTVLDTYLKDRTQRRYYAGIIPLLVETKKQLQAEKENEQLFTECLKRDSFLKTVPSDEEIAEAILWWKNKVIFQRPLSLDDKKSYRMILKRIKSSGNTEK